MWELIQANKRKSVFLFIGMAACLLTLGYFIGAAADPAEGGLFGLFISSFIWIILSLVSFFSGDSILLSASNAKEVSRDIHPQLFNVVEEMKIAANLPAVPKIYIIDEAAPNAFATGRNPEHSSVAVTAGLLSKLNRDELQGVVAHEMSHVLNRDILYMTCAGVLLGSIVMISDMFFRGMYRSSFSSSRYRSGSSRGGGQTQVFFIVLAVIAAILAPIFVRLLYFALSRKREYLADACGARLTRYPEGLASALEKIAQSEETLSSANQATAPMYIADPFKKEGIELSSLTSTHPPILERIKILRRMTEGAGFSDYENAFSNVHGKSAGIIPKSEFKSDEKIPIRKADPASTAPADRTHSNQPLEDLSKKLDKKEETRELGDLIRAVNQYRFLTCNCGLRIKVPADFKREKIICPKCWHELQVPGTGQPKETAAHSAPIEYVRKGTGWETFSCVCGQPVQVSPSFCGSHMDCRACGRRIVIKSLVHQ